MTDFRALAQPEPQGPSDEEIEAAARVIYGSMRFDRIGYTEPWVERGNSFAQDEARRCARAVLARWGRPVIEPVPVAERLPGSEDCDATGCCWAIDRRGDWVCIHVLGRSWSNPIYTHWLPHHALPVPQQETNDD